MSSALSQINSLINKIDNNMASESKQNESDCSIQILMGGNPLLDISSPVDDAFMKKYGIDPASAILAEDKHLPMYQELADKDTVEYIGGGSTLNSARVCQWMSQTDNFVGYMGCIGKDKFGQVLQDATKEAGVNCNFMIDESTPTGTCAVCITDKERYSKCIFLRQTSYI